MKAPLSSARTKTAAHKRPATNEARKYISVSSVFYGKNRVKALMGVT